MKMLIVNPAGRGIRQLPVCGRSGKTYGYAVWNQAYNGHVFELSMEDYRRYAPDICMQNVPLQSWYGIPVQESPSPNQQKPELDQILSSEFSADTDETLTDTARRLVLERDGLKLAMESLEGSRNTALTLARTTNDELRKMIKTYAPDEKGSITRERMVEILLDTACSPARQS